jgi:hypothetical protein
VPIIRSQTAFALGACGGQHPAGHLTAELAAEKIDYYQEYLLHAQDQLG